ncbi:MAG: Ig-like domain-containing protein, partial [Flavobacteriaceae bacterium]|nr:Ig-like domain-containing protein [Flavobacteriaceae bacterium]
MQKHYTSYPKFPFKFIKKDLLKLNFLIAIFVLNGNLINAGINEFHTLINDERNFLITTNINFVGITDAVDDVFIMYQNGVLTGNLFADNGNGPDDLGTQPTRLTNVSFADFGNLTVASNGNFTYIPDIGFYGIDTFTYTITDSLGNVSTSTVTIFVLKPPTAIADSFNLTEDTSVTGNLLNDNGNGPDELGVTPTTVIGNTNPSNGSVVVSSDGTFIYTPNSNFNGTDSFTYTISDSNGNQSTTTVSITVTLVNDVPVITSTNTYSTPEDTPLTATIIVTDVDLDVLTYTVISTTTNGVLTLNTTTGVWTYTPNANYNGSDSFTVEVSDGNGGIVTQVISITVTPVNDVPVITSLNSYSTAEDISLSATFVATDADSDVLTYTVTSTTTNGLLTFNTTTG